MEKDQLTRWPSKVPYNIYISIGGFGQNCNTNFDISQFGEGYVRVYKSLDKGHGSPPVEHVVEVGCFKIEDVKGKTVGEFLREVRIGIEKLVGVEVESNPEPSQTT